MAFLSRSCAAASLSLRLRAGRRAAGVGTVEGPPRRMAATGLATVVPLVVEEGAALLSMLPGEVGGAPFPLNACSAATSTPVREARFPPTRMRPLPLVAERLLRLPLPALAPTVWLRRRLRRGGVADAVQQAVQRFSACSSLRCTRHRAGCSCPDRGSYVMCVPLQPTPHVRTGQLGRVATGGAQVDRRVTP